MRSQPSLRPWWSLLLLCFLSSYASAHTILTYPGWRGNTLHTNGTVEGVSGLGVGIQNDTLVYPYGMEWAYPCGGMPQSENRTKWPVGGGAVAFQPGWFPGHKTAFIYINLGLGTIPPNMSHPMIAPFQLVGPTKNPYPGTFCMPQVPLPAGITVNVGDNATIQLIETAVHGAALYNCVDITFAEPEDVEPVTRDNCFNSTQLSANIIYAMDSDPTSSSAVSVLSSPATGIAALPLLLIGLLGFFL